MDDSHILATDGGCVLSSQLGDNLLNHIHGEQAIVGQRRTRGNSSTICLGAVGNIGAGVQDITDDGVQSQTCLTTQQLGSLQDGVVQSGQLKDIGLGDEVAVLSHLSGDGADLQGLAVRSDTFGQGGQSLSQRGELTELNGLTAIGRDGTLLTELIVNQVSLSLVNQGHIVEGLHFGRQTLMQGGLHISKELQVDVLKHGIFSFHK